jgi:putative flavoprotein involved in K+ transport
MRGSLIRTELGLTHAMATENVETLIVGGGQAGLAVSHMLSLSGSPHLILERGRIAERWRTERWDGLRFQFPNWSVLLPDFPFRRADADGFATSPEIVEYLTSYADYVRAPIRCGVTVTRLRHGEGASGFLAETSAGPVASANVVVATGPYQRPIIPTLLQNDTWLFQVHASKYRAPDQLPAGAVLVVGSGASGAQIAEELLRANRRVYLSVGHHRRMPRRYRGRDLIWWLSFLGLDRTPTEKRGPDRSLPLITGAYGGHTIDFRAFARQGMTLLGRVVAGENGILDIAPDLAKNLASGDASYASFLDMVDAHIARQDLDIPAEPGARTVYPDPPYVAEPLRRLDLRAEGVGSVIWATGYSCDFSWIDLPVIDGAGEPVHRGGITDVPGLYFLGLQWLSKMNSSFLSGIGEDAARLADHIVARRTA